jgi:hypothetical protein
LHEERVLDLGGRVQKPDRIVARPEGKRLHEGLATTVSVSA